MRMHAETNLFPEEVENYMKEKATFELNLKLEHFDESLKHSHDKGTEFKALIVANSHGFSEDTIVAYTLLTLQGYTKYMFFIFEHLKNLVGVKMAVHL